MRKDAGILSAEESQALDRLFGAESDLEIEALVASSELARSDSFLRKAVAMVPRNEDGGLAERLSIFAFYLHAFFHTSLTHETSGHAEHHDDSMPPLFRYLVDVVGASDPPRHDGNPLVPSDRDRIAAAIAAYQPAAEPPGYEPNAVSRWTLLICDCTSCGRRTLATRVHQLIVGADRSIARAIYASGATTARCQCGAAVFDPECVWVQEEPQSNDRIDALCTVVRVSSQFGVYATPTWGYSPSRHGMLLELRAASSVGASTSDDMRTSALFAIPYSEHELLEWAFDDEHHVFRVVASMIAFRLAHGRISLEQATQLAKQLAGSMDLGPPRVSPPIHPRPWYPVGLAILSEAMAEVRGLPAADRARLALQTATALTSVRQLGAVRSALARAELHTRKVENPEGRAELEQAHREAKGDLLARQGDLRSGAMRVEQLAPLPADASDEETVSYWYKRSLQALHAKMEGRLADAAQQFVEVIPALYEAYSVASDAEGQLLGAHGLSGAFANLAGTLLLVADAEAPDQERIVSCVEDMLTTIGAIAEKPGAEDKGKKRDLRYRTLWPAYVSLVNALRLSRLIENHEYEALQLERVGAVLHALGEFEHLPEITRQALHAATTAGASDAAARAGLRLAEHELTHAPKEALRYAEVAALAAARLTVEEGLDVTSAPSEYATAACTLAVAATVSDSSLQHRAIVVLENAKAISVHAGVAAGGVPRPIPEPSSDAYAEYVGQLRQQERLRAESLIADDLDIEVIDRELQDVGRRLAELRTDLAPLDRRYLSWVDSTTMGVVDIGAMRAALRAIGANATYLGFFTLGEAVVSYAVWNEGHSFAVVEWPTWKDDAVALRASAQTGDLSEKLLARASAILTPHRDRIATLGPDDVLVVSPHDDLSVIPFCLLEVGGRLLCETCTLVYSAGIGMFMVSADSEPPVDRSLLAIGAPSRTTPAPPVYSRDEALGVARLFEDVGKNAKLLLGSEPTPRAIAEHAATATVLHFACHGSLGRGDVLPAHLVLAENPEQDESGIFTAARVATELELSMNPLVVLAACDSGEYRVSTNVDNYSLIPAFMLAGASSVVAALWAIGDLSALIFMDDFYRGLLRGLSPSSALAATVRAARAGELGDALMSASVWAAFVLHGR
jgi:CHAT domain-containing protein